MSVPGKKNRPDYLDLEYLKSNKMFEYLKGAEGWCYKETGLQYILSSSKNWSILAPRRGKNLPDDHDLEYLKGGRGLELVLGLGPPLSSFGFHGG